MLRIAIGCWFMAVLLPLGVLSALSAAEPAIILEAQGSGTQAITLQWTASGTYSELQVQRSAENHSWTTIASLAPTASTWTDSGLAVRRLYFYRILGTGSQETLSNWTFASSLQAVSAAGEFRSVAASWQHDATIRVSWREDFGDETGFRIERSTSGESFVTLAELPANSASYHDPSTLQQATAYKYRVTAIGNGAECQSNEVAPHTVIDNTFILGSQWSSAVAVPQNVSVSEIPGQGLQIQWDAVAGATKYGVMWSHDQNVWRLIDDPSTTSATFSGLLPNITHYVAVYAYNGGQYSLPSAPIAAEVSGTSTTSATFSPLQLVRNGSNITLSWSDPGAGETAYVVEAIDGLSISERATLAANTTSHTLAFADDRAWRIRREGSELGISTVATLIVAEAPPAAAAPQQLAVSVQSSNHLQLTWTVTPNSGSLPKTIVQRSDDAGVTWRSLELIRGGNTTSGAQSYDDYLCDHQRTYMYRVFLESDPSLQSAVVSGTTPANTSAPQQPTGFSATAVSTSQINLAWTDRSDNEVGFRVEHSSNGGSTWSTAGELDPGSESWVADGLSANQNMRYRIVATGASGNTTTSALSATTINQDPVPSASAVSFKEYTEWVITGSAANDDLRIQQTATDVQLYDHDALLESIAVNGIQRIRILGAAGDDLIEVTATVAMPVVIHGGPGNDNIVAFASAPQVLVAIGEGKDRLEGNGSSTIYWADQHPVDQIIASAAEVAAGNVHQIERFSQPLVSGETQSPFFNPTSAKYRNKVLAGQDWPDGSIYNTQSLTRLSAVPAWPRYPSLRDVNQGFHQDCPYTSLFQALADRDPVHIQNTLVDLGDNTFAGPISYAAPDLYTRVDGEVDTTGLVSGLGTTDAQWWMIGEKIWAYGLSFGPPFAQQRTATISPAATDQEIVSAINAALDQDELVYAWTRSAGNAKYSSLGQATAYSHQHSVHAAWLSADGSGRIIVKNPYGTHYQFSSGPVDPAEGLMLLTLDQFRYNFSDLYAESLQLPVQTPTLASNPDHDPVIDVAASASPELVTGTTTTLTVGAIDDDGDTLTYSWSVLTSPPGSNPTIPLASINPTVLVTFDMPGEYRFAVTISDGNATGSDTIGQTPLVVVVQTASGLGITP